MADSGKTVVANVLVALTCRTIATTAFLSHRARDEDQSIEYLEWLARVEATTRTVPVSTTEENAMAGSPVVLTCRQDHVGLTSGVHKDEPHVSLSAD